MIRAAVIVAAVLTLSGCNQAAQAAWVAMSPGERHAYLTATQPSSDCYAAIDRHWPASSRAWARSIVWRESRGIATAANPNSSARGCGQLLLSLHGWRFTAVGCSPSQWADPDCNVLAMLHLYREAGTSPWA